MAYFQHKKTTHIFRSAILTEVSRISEVIFTPKYNEEGIYTVRFYIQCLMETTFGSQLLCFKQEGFLLGAGSPLGSDVYFSSSGIVQGHAYSLLQVRVVDGHKLVQILCPYQLNRPDRMQDHSSHDRVNPVKGAIVFSNIVTIVSRTYAPEVRTAEGGKGLHATLNSHSKKFVGILNGIDIDAWNPATDTYLKVQYSANDLHASDMFIIPSIFEPCGLTQWDKANGLSYTQEKIDKVLDEWAAYVSTYM